MVIVAMNKNDQAPTKKTGLLNWFAALKLFEPILVNKNWTGAFKPIDGADPEKVPSFDQFLNTSYAAYTDLQDFIKLHEQLKTRCQMLQHDGASAHLSLQNVGIKVESLQEGAEMLVTQRNQLLDVVENLCKHFNDETSTGKDQIRHASEAFCRRLKAGHAGATASSVITGKVPESGFDIGGGN